MLRLMRDYATSWLIKIILGAIIVVFVFWGIGNFKESKENQIAVVNDDLISGEEYRDAYNRLVERYRQFGAELNEEMVKRLEKQAIDNLIDQKLLLQEAQHLNLRVSEDELAAAIMKTEVFQIEGKFSKGHYERVLNANRLSTKEFEIEQRKSMLTDKVRSYVMNSIKISDEEAFEWYKWNDASVRIAYTLLSSEKYQNIEVSDEDVKKFFEARKDAYKTEPEVKVQYLRFGTEECKTKVSLTDEEIKEYFEANPEEFKKEKTVGARHILLKLDKNSSDEVVEEKRKKALEIIKTASEGKDFGELAKQYSEDEGSKPNGGDLGEFDRKMMVKPFSDKAFSMKAGEISEPVKSQFGWHVIKVEKVNEEKTLSFEESKETIKNKLTEEKAKNIAYDEAEAVSGAAFEGDDLAKIASSRSLKIITTDSFSKKKGPKEVKNPVKFSTEAFKLSLKEISEIQDFGDGYYILQVIEQVPEKMSEYKEVAEKAKKDLLKEKQEEKAGKEAEEFLAVLKKGENMETECQKRGLEIKTSEFFKRNDSIPDIGYEREIVQAAFSLSEDKKFSEKPLKARKGYYIISFKERKTPEPEEFEKEKEKTKERLLQQKKFKTLEKWMAALKNKSQISILADFLAN
ncbi:MAG: hypothetical protein BWK80_18990 [Desulfobacteraceae bacterium IS3]|nr:MAG: hypothetical protein BWK80_18990 [Desulfobacteraceae bacterium IS3]